MDVQEILLFLEPVLDRDTCRGLEVVVAAGDVLVDCAHGSSLDILLVEQLGWSVLGVASTTAQNKCDCDCKPVHSEPPFRVKVNLAGLIR